jgi:indoleamine 2,3-dioxygenase
MPALVAGIHVLDDSKDVDGRDKPGHDGGDLQVMSVQNHPIDLASFGVSRARGFVPERDPPDALPEPFRAWDDVAPILPALIMNQDVRRFLAAIPELDPSPLQDGAEAERAMMILASLTMAHVWGGKTPDFTLPRNIAVPLMALSQRLGRPPIVMHATLVLNNWRRLDPAQPLALDNVDTQLTFTGSFDEKWFYLATLGVELAGAPAIVALTDAVTASQDGDDSALAQKLGALEAGIRQMTTALMRMTERCDPYVFYHRIRPHLAGWPAPGLLYAGTGTPPQVWAGGSAAQSSLLQSIDAGLGIRHEHVATQDFLDSMQLYMPPPHRAFVAALRERSTVRERALQGAATLRDAYNTCIAATDEFRRKHIGITSQYIIKQASTHVGPGTTGTGGTDFVEFLRESRVETARSQLK